MFKPFQRYNFTCGHEGEIVYFSYGGQEISMHYRDLLKILQIQYVHAKLAKNETGDNSMTFNCFGVLKDAEENYKLSVPRHL